MRIDMVSEHASPLAAIGSVDAGGQNIHVAELALALGRLGHDLVVHTRRDRPDLPKTVRLGPRVVVEHVDAGPPVSLPKDELFPFMTEFGERRRERWRIDRPHVVHAHFWMSGVAATTAAQPLLIPVVQTFHALGAVKLRHQGLDDTSPSERVSFERDLLDQASAVIATCRDEVHELIELGARVTALHVVPCGVDLRTFNTLGARAGTPGGRRLLAVSRLVPRKGLADAILALTELPDAHLTIVGGPPLARLRGDAEYCRLRQIAVEARVIQRVDFTGGLPQKEVAALMRSADVLVCVPWYEPFGMVPVEAMACGAPVIGSAVGGLLDTIVDGETGWLVPPHRPDCVADVARTVLTDRRLRRAVGRAAANRACASYSWDHVARLTEAVYSKVAAQRPYVARVAS